MRWGAQKIDVFVALHACVPLHASLGEHAEQITAGIMGVDREIRQMGS